MTRTISLITATVGAVLLLAAPAAADNWAADRRSEPVGYLNPDSGDRAAALEQQRLALTLDAREKSQTAAHRAPLLSEPGSAIVVDDRFDLHAQNVPTTEASAASGWDVDLGQVGLGFGIGILLATGLALGLRYTRLHRLAH